jgi:hypothetical protein
MSDQATGSPDPSLDAASTAIDSLLFPKETKETTAATPPEKPVQPEPKAPVADEQAAGDEAVETKAKAEAEAVVEGDEVVEDPDKPQPRLIPVKVNGKVVMVTEEEAASGYSRTEDYTRKTQALADRQRQFEQDEVTKVRAERELYAQNLGKISDALKAMTPAEPDWEVLRTQVSAETFAAEVLAYNQRQKQIERVEAEKAKVAEVQNADAEKGFRNYLQQEGAKLAEVIPDFKVPEKATKLRAELQEFGKSLGFTENDLAGVTDHRMVVVLHNAMLHDRAQKAKPKVESKIATALAASTPGASRTSTPRKQSELTTAKTKLAKSGSVDDGAAAIAALLDL